MNQKPQSVQNVQMTQSGKTNSGNTAIGYLECPFNILYNIYIYTQKPGNCYHSDYDLVVMGMSTQTSGATKLMSVARRQDSLSPTVEPIVGLTLPRALSIF